MYSKMRTRRIADLRQDHADLAIEICNKVLEEHCMDAIKKMLNRFDICQVSDIWDGVFQLLGGEDWHSADAHIDRTARFIAAGAQSQDWTNVKGGLWK